MRLTRLEIIGFKSFGDRTVLSFQPGITAVVGPNGCGKSNIADAILWCLGEQSPKTLRGDRMDDVLFNGSAKRPPAGLAEVSLTLSGIRPEEIESPAGAYSELTITRRLYRSGESDYLINRVSCRLKDIRDLLIETGAGAKGHTVLEQGKVDGIINASPVERRALVEESAGIAKYKIRKTEALRKLESTEQNLLRVRDIVGEVKRQLASLDRQAKKAERYRHTYDQLKGLELWTAGTRYRDWLAQMTDLSASLEIERTEEARLMAELGALDAAIEARKTDATDLDCRLHEAQAELIAADTRAQKARHRMQFLAAQTDEWHAQGAALALELEGLAGTLVERQTEYANCQAGCDAGDAALEEQAALLASREAVVQVIEHRMAHMAAEIEQIRHRILETASAMATCTNIVNTFAVRREELAKRRARYQADLDATQSELTEKRARHQEIEAAHTLHVQSHALRDAERTALRDASVGRQAALQEGEAVLTARHADLTKWRAMQESLLTLQRDFVGYDEGVRYVLGADSVSPVPGLLGVIADVLEIPSQYERAIEGALADRLQAVIAEGHAEIMAALEVLDHHPAGRTTFAPRMPPVEALPPPEWSSLEGVHGLAGNLVGCRSGFERLHASLFARLVVIDDRETARRLCAGDRQGYTWVTLAGEVFYSNGMVSGGGGPRTGLSLLERKRTIKKLEQDIQEAEGALHPLETAAALLQSTIEADRRALTALDAELRESELQLMHDRTAAEALLQELAQLDKRAQLLISEGRDAEDEFVGMAVTIADNQTALALHETRKAHEESALLEQYGNAAQLKSSLTEATAAVTEVRLVLATERQKREHAVSVLRTLQTRIQEITGQITAKTSAKDLLENRASAAMQEREGVVTTLDSSEIALQQLRLTVAELERSRADAAYQIREQEDIVRMRRREADGLQQRLQALAVAVAETKLRAAQQVAEISDRYQMDLTVLERHDLPQPSCEPSDVESAILRLRETLAQLGGVNLGAIDEYRELEERHRFLTAQEADLVESLENLHAAIRKINDTTRDLFLDAFHALSERFGSVYTSFFEGGHAELRLVEETNPLESGIEIVAQPPGKKLRHISLLSGGEKALTAIALLFASFLIHPSPFCVMDEIDAPLDEENVRRFTRALRPMTAHSQFLIVTHNRRTMEQADMLYGVTMEDPGVSKLVSVRLNREANQEVVEVETAAGLV
ncbi:MAG: chromosome segregation protein SMC [Nitrospiria bacterium]